MKFYITNLPSIIIAEECFSETTTDESGLVKRTHIGKDLAWICREIRSAPAPLNEVMKRLAKVRGVEFDEFHTSQVAEALRRLSFLKEVDLDLPDHDLVIVEQGVGGVYTHALDLWRELNRTHRALLICPEDPPYATDEERAHPLLFTPSTLRKRGIEMESGWSMPFLSVLRWVLSQKKGKLLLFTHKLLLPYVFDLIPKWRTIAYCDGYAETYDLLFKMLTADKDEVEERERVLAELLYSFRFNGKFGNVFNMSLIKALGWAMAAVSEGWLWYPSPEAEYYGVKYEVVPPHVDSRRFGPTEIPRENMVLLTTSMQNFEEKGGTDLFALIERLSKSVKFVLVCTPTVSLVRFAEGRENVTIVDRASREEMVRYYQRAGVYFRVGIKDSVPISIIEALACGTPVLTSPIIVEHFPALEEGVNVMVAEPGDIEDQAEKIQKILSDRETAHRLGENGRRMVMENYTMDRLARKVIDRLSS